LNDFIINLNICYGHDRKTASFLSRIPVPSYLQRDTGKAVPSVCLYDYHAWDCAKTAKHIVAILSPPAVAPLFCCSQNYMPRWNNDGITISEGFSLKFRWLYTHLKNCWANRCSSALYVFWQDVLYKSMFYLLT